MHCNENARILEMTDKDKGKMLYAKGRNSKRRKFKREAMWVADGKA